jgi:hypothetical protein
MQSERKGLEKATDTLLERAKDCFDLADSHHAQAETQHEIASRQTQSPPTQEVIAANQHGNADWLEAKAENLKSLGDLMVADAAQINGETQVRPRE